MPVPTNTSSATALVITALPYSITLDAFEVQWPGSLWFRYDKTVGSNVVLGLASPVPLTTGTYAPKVNVWWDNGGVLEAYLDIISFSRPITIPVSDPVVTSFYFEVRQPGATVFTEQLEFRLEVGPNVGAPAGSFAINDDTAYFPMAIVSLGGEVLQSFPFPAGERAGMTASGYSLWEQTYPNSAFLYSPQFVQIAEVPWDLATAQGEIPISASPSTLYLADPGRVSAPTRNARVTTVTTAGALGPTIWDLGSYFVWAMAPSRDDTILYYTQGSGPAAIKRWDLINDMALSDLVASIPSTIGLRDLIVLDDGSVISGHKPNPAGPASYMKRYSAAGATLNTYTQAAGVSLNRLAPSSLAGAFWAWSFITGGFAQFDRYRASDGVILDTFTAPVNVGGVLESTNPNEPTQGLSFSCPFLEIPEALPPITFDEAVPSPVYRVRNNLIRRQRRTPYLVDENRWTFHRRIIVDLEPGVGTPTGQGVNPQVMLRWSDDGGKTWGHEHWRTAGRQGVYTTRAIWRVLGRSRGRVYELTVSDPVAWNVAAAYIDAGPGVRG